MREQATPPRTRVRGSSYDAQGRLLRSTAWKSNLILYEWGAIVARALALGGSAYKIGAMYLEYANSVPPITPPTFDRTGGSPYYATLATSLHGDYLRVPMTAGVVDTSDATLFPKGNLCRFFALSAGTTGVWGKPFAAINNSTVFGAALVATPDFGDPTQDLLLSRFYFDTSDQLTKGAGQLSVEWELIWE